jgi:hypothetical protein
MAYDQVYLHIEERMKVFEESLFRIEESRQEEMKKPFGERNYKVLYMLNRDDIFYQQCMNELLTIKKML